MPEPHIQRYRFDIAYDGTAYAGWQIQPNGLAVQQVVETALARITGQPAKVHGSGRTDRGVHARCQVAHADLQARMPVTALLRGLNGVLPSDIRVSRVRRAAADFHARRSAVRKEYRYFIWNAPILPPTLRLYRAHVVRPLDVAPMRSAAELLKGTHDFNAFAANPDREQESTVRTLSELRVTRRGHEITIVARSEGFLYKMVRSLAGFLMRVGEGAVPPSEARVILQSRLRTARVPTAPPQGLFLWNVWY